MSSREVELGESSGEMERAGRKGTRSSYPVPQKTVMGRDDAMTEPSVKTIESDVKWEIRGLRTTFSSAAHPVRFVVYEW